MGIASWDYIPFRPNQPRSGITFSIRSAEKETNMATTTKLAKPAMRNLLTSRLKIETIIGSVLTIVAGVAWKYGVQEPRKKVYAEFYKNYDAEADFERMRLNNVFQVVDAEGNINTDF